MVQASVKEASPGRCSGHAHLGGHPKPDPGHEWRCSGQGALIPIVSLVNTRVWVDVRFFTV